MTTGARRQSNCTKVLAICHPASGTRYPLLLSRSLLQWEMRFATSPLRSARCRRVADARV